MNKDFQDHLTKSQLNYKMVKRGWNPPIEFGTISLSGLVDVVEGTSFQATFYSPLLGGTGKCTVILMDINTDEIFINCANSGEQDLIEVTNGDILL